MWVTLVNPYPQVIQMQCNLERSEDKARWHVSRAGVGAHRGAREGKQWGGWGTLGANHAPLPPQLTLLLVLEDRLHRQLTYDLLPSRPGGDPGRDGCGCGPRRWPHMSVLPLPVPLLQPTVPRTLPPSWYTMASFTRCVG